MTAAANRPVAAVCATVTSATPRCTFRSSRMTTTGVREMPRRMFPITARPPVSLQSRSKRRLDAAALLLLGVWGLAQGYEPAVNYMLHCMGCHTPDGAGEPGRVPSLRDTLVPFAGVPAGRRFLVQVPGSAQSKLSDAELAEVLNWMVTTLSV